MKIEENMKEWFSICIITAVVLAVLFGMGQCTNADIAKRKKRAKEKPVEYAKERCYSKIRGSRPACWTEGDWIEFCKRVQCKQR